MCNVSSTPCRTLTVHRRFFRARQYDVPGALKQFGDAYTARQVNRVCEFYEKIKVEDYEETQRLVRARHIF